MIDLDAYLHRIGYSGDRAATLSTLRDVLWSHATAIPFENLSSYLGEPVAVSLPEVARKIVGEGRGGYCYELNTLLGAALEALGFVVVPMLARVRWQVPAEVVTGRSHLCLRVEIDGEEWLVDGGFGGVGPSSPLRLAETTVQETPHERRRLTPRSDGTIRHEVETAPGEWRDVFHLELTRIHPVDVEVANWFTSTHPDSFFRHSLIVTLVQADHRRVLWDRELSRRFTDGRVERRTIGDLAELKAVLVEEFGLPADHSVMGRLRLPAAADE